MPSDTEIADNGEKMPTDKLVDISPLALRMSSPFNAGYWLSAACRARRLHPPSHQESPLHAGFLVPGAAMKQRRY